MRHVIGIGGIGLMVLLCLRVGAADKVEEAAGMPQSPAAVAAVKKYDRATARAREAYQAALAAAGRDLKGEMDVALKGAMRAQNLDEAKRIEAAVRRAEASAGTGGGGGGGTFVVRTVLYGGADKRFDLTEDLIKAGWVREGSVDLPKDLATTLGKDPAPGRLKDLQLLLTVGGTDVRISTNDVTRLQIRAGSGGK